MTTAVEIMLGIGFAVFTAVCWCAIVEALRPRRNYVEDFRSRQLIMKDVRRGTPECAGRVR